MKKLTVGSLFAGVGGICLGFQNAHFNNQSYELAVANEIDPYACQTYRSNFVHTLVEGNIDYIINPKESDDKEHYQKLHDQFFAKPLDVLTAGFPCQSFSLAGYRKGFADERGNLFFSIIKVIKELKRIHKKQPRFLFLENVKNLKNHDNGRTYKIIKSTLEDCGYTVKEAVLNTMDYSTIPQNRERIYILGFLKKKDAKRFTMFDRLGEYKEKFTVAERHKQIKSILDKKIKDTKYFYTKEKYPLCFGKNGQVNLAKDITEQNEFYQLRRVYVRKNKSHVCPTLTANMGTGGHNVPLILTKDGIRKLTPAETFRLQGFPVGKGYILPKEFNGKPYSDSRLYKQAGNSVSVPIITLLATEILKTCCKK